jgi:hypothetical protein
MRFELDKLEEININDPLGKVTDLLDLVSVGVLGHSFGGATVAQFYHKDARCRAGIDIYGATYGNLWKMGLDKSFLFILSDHADESDPESQKIRDDMQSISDQLPNRITQITLLGSRHFNFKDKALLKEQRLFRLVGALSPINERRALAILSNYIRGFFDIYLNNTLDVLVNGPSLRYPKVSIESE